MHTLTHPRSRSRTRTYVPTRAHSRKLTRASPLAQAHLRELTRASTCMAMFRTDSSASSNIRFGTHAARAGSDAAFACGRAHARTRALCVGLRRSRLVSCAHVSSGRAQTRAMQHARVCSSLSTRARLVPDASCESRCRGRRSRGRADR
eukprot:3135344-Pleurochrysis_carterae.AAC.1